MPLKKALACSVMADTKETYVMEINSENMLKALLLLVQKMNELNSTMSRIENLLTQVVSPKQEENN